MLELKNHLNARFISLNHRRNCMFESIICLNPRTACLNQAIELKIQELRF